MKAGGLSDSTVFEVFSVTSEQELWATLGLKQADVELRIVLPLDDAGVQAFFR